MINSLRLCSPVHRTRCLANLAGRTPQRLVFSAIISYQNDSTSVRLYSSKTPRSRAGKIMSRSQKLEQEKVEKEKKQLEEMKRLRELQQKQQKAAEEKKMKERKKMENQLRGMKEDKKPVNDNQSNAPTDGQPSKPKEDQKRQNKDKKSRSPTVPKVVPKPEPKPKKIKEFVAVKPTLTIPKFISLSNFANVVNIKFSKLVNLMSDMGFTELAHNHIIDEETAGLVAEELGFTVVMDDSLGLDIFPAPKPEDLSKVPSRPPIVTIMGHVDHGKTTILDYLRNASVADSEHGGITQHIGAFSVKMSDDKEICFLDTPGHAAFLNMRERGANVTDIIVLVVAADDSVMPQTKEAIKHAKNAGVPIIVAINKMDKPDANPKKVIEDLSRNEVDVEDYGGETQTVQVSGKTGKGIDVLEEAIITLSEMLELKAPKVGNAEGWVVESQLKKGQGSSATVLVRRGTLKVGSFVVAGNTWCKVRSMRDSYGKAIKSAGPGTPVEVTGWKDLPHAGDEMLQAESEGTAKRVVENRINREKITKSAEDVAAINEQRRSMQLEQEKEAVRRERIRMGLPPEVEPTASEAATIEKQEGPTIVPFIIKADVSGSAEAVADSIQGLGNGEVQSSVLYKGVGAVNDNDLVRAEAAGATILTFNIATDRDLLHKLEQKHIPFMEHRIIYKLLEDVTAQLASKLAPEIKHKVLGEATIKEIFSISLKRSKTLHVAGTRISNGIISRSSKVKVLRNNEVVYTGTLSSLKHFKEEVSEAKKDTECGISFNNWDGFKEGDLIQSFEEITIQRHF